MTDAKIRVLTNAELKALLDEYMDLLIAWLEFNYVLLDDGTTDTCPYRLESRWPR